MKRKILAAVLMLAMVMGLLAGCSSAGSGSSGNDTPGNDAPGSSANDAGSTPEAQDDGFVVGLAMHNQTADFTVQVYETFKEGIEAMGGTVVMTDASGDASLQVNQINDLVVQNVDYIVVCPQDASALGAALAEANEAGIPVVNLDSKVCDEDLDKVVCVISSANYEGGYVLGEWVAAHCESGDELAYINYPQIEAIAIRFNGMVDAIGASGKDITLYEQIMTDTSKTVNYCEDLLMAHPDLRGIIGLNDAIAMTAYSVLSENQVEDPLTAGFDGSPAGKQSIAAGEMTGTVVNSPVSLAKAAVDVVKILREGGTVDFEIPVSMWIIDAANLSEYGMDGWN